MPGNWGAFAPEILAALMENGPGSGPMRQTAASFRQLRETFENLAESVDSILRQLFSTWNGEAADGAAQSFRQYLTGLREMATVADTVSQQADSQADANDSARSSMPKLADILAVLAAHAAALASQNYGLAAALMAIYNTMRSQASSTMSGYEAASLPNMEQPPAQQAPSVTNQSPSASEVSQLTDLFNGQRDESFEPPDPMDIPPSSSSTLAELNGGASTGGSGFGIPGAIGLALGTAGAVASVATGFRMPLEAPRALGLPTAGVPATGPMGGVPPMLGHGGQRRRDREKERATLDGTVVAPDHSDEVPDIAGLGVVVEPDDLAASGHQPA